MTDYERDLKVEEVTEFYHIHCVARSICFAVQGNAPRAVYYFIEAIFAKEQLETWKKIKADHPG